MWSKSPLIANANVVVAVVVVVDGDDDDVVVVAVAVDLNNLPLQFGQNHVSNR